MSPTAIRSRLDSLSYNPGPLGTVTLQQVEIPQTPTVATEHRGLAYWCPHCRKVWAYGHRLWDVLSDLFGVIHRRENMTAAGFQKALEAAREQVIRAATTHLPDANHARNLAQRFREHGEAYFRFMTTPGIDPTNNLAEQAIRFVVIDRHIPQGTRSATILPLVTGRRWCERIWTVIATCLRQRIWTVIAACAQQGRAVFQLLLDSVQAHLCGTPPPSLLPSGP